MKTTRSHCLQASLFALCSCLSLAVYAGSVTPPEGVELSDLTNPATGIVTDSGHYVNYAGAYLFDNVINNANSRWLCPGKTGWVTYQFPMPAVVNAYRMYNAGPSGYNQTTRAPKSWVFEASLDGENWTTLDEQTYETNWKTSESRFYQFGNIAAFLYYRLRVTGINGGTDYVQLDELEFFNINAGGSSLQIASDPTGIGTSSPAYGSYPVTGGDTIILSIPPVVTNQIQTVEYTCIGWELSSSSSEPIEGTSNTYELNVLPNENYLFRWKFSARRFRDAKSVYVSENGSDSNSGISPDDAFATISAAVNAVADETDPTICVLPGTYKDESEIELNKDIQVIGLGTSPNDVVLHNTRSPSYGKIYMFFSLNHPNAVVANMTLVNGSVFQNTRPGAVNILENGGTLSNCVVRGNSVYHSFDRSGAVWIHSDKGRVTQCLFEKNFIDRRTSASWQSGYQGGSAIFMQNGRVDNCVFANNYAIGVDTNYWSVSTLTMQGGTVENCTFVGNDGSMCAGICLDGNSASKTIRNVAFYNNRINPKWRTPENTLDHAIVIRNSTTHTIEYCAFDLDETIGEYAIANLSANDFRDAENGDYVPSNASPLIDAGPRAESFSLDFRGAPRLFGYHLDIGAFEVPDFATRIFIR